MAERPAPGVQQRRSCALPAAGTAGRGRGAPRRAPRRRAAPVRCVSGPAPPARAAGLADERPGAADMDVARKAVICHPRL